MSPVELVGAIREHEQDRGVAKVADEESDQVAGRAIGPVEVLQDEHDGCGRGQPLEHAKHHLEQPGLRPIDAWPGGHAPGFAGEVRHEPGQLRPRRADHGLEHVRVGPPEEAAERLGDRREREGAVADDDAAPAEQDRALGLGEVAERGSQSGLADARFAGDQHRAAATLHGEPERGTQPIQLMGSPDEHRARDAGRHVPEYGALRRHHQLPQTRERALSAGRRPVVDPSAHRQPGARAAWSSP